MFSSLNSGKDKPTGGPLGTAAFGGIPQPDKPQKPLTAKEKYEIAKAGGVAFTEDSNHRVLKAMESFNAVANNSYWFYGYGAGCMLFTLAGSLAISGRWPFFRSYCGFIALAGGYFGGKFCTKVHTAYYQTKVIDQINAEIKEAKRLDELNNGLIPDYKHQAEHLLNMKYQVLPDLPEAVEARQAENKSIDDRVDNLVDSYIKKKSALAGK